VRGSLKRVRHDRVRARPLQDEIQARDRLRADKCKGRFQRRGLCDQAGRRGQLAPQETEGRGEGFGPIAARSGGAHEGREHGLGAPWSALAPRIRERQGSEDRDGQRSQHRQEQGGRIDQ
jgi:hypothetical protein